MYIKNNRGQSTVEYVLLVTAVLAVIIALVAGNNNTAFKGQLTNTLNSAIGDIDSKSTALSDSHAGSNATSNSATAGNPPTSFDVTP